MIHNEQKVSFSQIINDRMLLQQEQNQFLGNVIEAYSDLKIKNTQKYNRNKYQRSILQISTNFYSFLQKISILRVFCEDYRTSLQCYKRQQEQINNNQLLRNTNYKNHNNKPDINLQHPASIHPPAQQQDFSILLKQHLSFPKKPLHSQQYLQPQQSSQPNNKPVIVLPIKTIQSQKQQLSLSLNKLKVMIIKVNTKLSSSYQSCYSTYLSRLLNTLKNSNFDLKRYKNYRIKKLLNYLPKKYIVLNTKSLLIYPYHNTRYVNQYEYEQIPMFFINFHVQQLLFMNQIPVKLKQNFSDLLYCPIILEKSSPIIVEKSQYNNQVIYQNRQKNMQESLKISDWYMNNLSLIDSEWNNKFLLIKIYDTQTSLRQPIIYSHINFTKYFTLPDQLKHLDQQQYRFNFMNTQLQKQQQLLKQLQNIKTYIYSELIYKHLQSVFTSGNDIIINGKQSKRITRNYIEFFINSNFKCEIVLQNNKILKQHLIQRQNGGNNKINFNIINSNNQQQQYDPIFNPQFILALLLFYKRKNLFLLNKRVLRQQLMINMKSTLCKVLCEKIQYRTINPLYQGSLGLYFYEKKSVKKQSVQLFFSQFKNNNGNNHTKQL